MFFRSKFYKHWIQQHRVELYAWMLWVRRLAQSSQIYLKLSSTFGRIQQFLLPFESNVPGVSAIFSNLFCCFLFQVELATIFLAIIDKRKMDPEVWIFFNLNFNGYRLGSRLKTKKTILLMLWFVWRVKSNSQLKVHSGVLLIILFSNRTLNYQLILTLQLDHSLMTKITCYLEKTVEMVFILPASTRRRSMANKPMFAQNTLAMFRMLKRKTFRSVIVSWKRLRTIVRNFNEQSQQIYQENAQRQFALHAQTQVGRSGHIRHFAR